MIDSQWTGREKTAVEILLKEKECGALEWKVQLGNMNMDTTDDLCGQEPEKVPALKSEIR